MEVRFFAFFRQMTGEKATEAFSSATVNQLMHDLCQHYGKPLSDWLCPDGKFGKDVIVLVNGRAIEHLNGIDTQLSEQDVIALFPRIAGG